MSFGNEDWPGGFVKGRRRTIRKPAILFRDAAGEIVGKMTPIGRADYMGQAIGQVPSSFYKESTLFMRLTCYGHNGNPNPGAVAFAFGPEMVERFATVEWLRGGA